MTINNVIILIKDNVEIIISGMALIVSLFVACFNTRQSRIDSVFQIAKNISEQRYRAHEAYLKYMNTTDNDTAEEYVYRERISEYVNSFEIACELYNKNSINRKLFKTLLKDELDNIHSRKGLAFDLDQNDYLPEIYTSIEKTFNKLQNKDMKEKLINIIKEYKNYIFLVIILLAVILGAKLFGFKNWNSIAPSIYTGIITSAFVSVLILIEGDRRQRNKNKSLKEDLLLDVIDEIINYFSFFSFWAASQCDEYNRDLPFIEWSKIYIENAKKGKFKLMHQNEISSRTKKVCCKVDELMSKKSLLYDNGVINILDLEDLNKIKSAFARDWFIEVSGEKFSYEHLRVFNTNIHNTLSKLPEYKWLVETAYGFDNQVLEEMSSAKRTKVYNDIFKK